jgi:hypothetical protein
MSIKDILEMRVDRTKISVFSSFEESEKAEREYWRSRTPEERMLALEMMRRIAYGYDEDSPGLQRVLEITERP